MKQASLGPCGPYVMRASRHAGRIALGPKGMWPWGMRALGHCGRVGCGPGIGACGLRGKWGVGNAGLGACGLWGMRAAGHAVFGACGS